MNDAHLPRIILNAKLDGRRKVGRPRLCWMDDVQADLRKIGITNWRKKAIGRGEWMVIKREAKVKFERTVTPMMMMNISKTRSACPAHN